jgi:hypothetical protein
LPKNFFDSQVLKLFRQAIVRDLTALRVGRLPDNSRTFVAHLPGLEIFNTREVDIEAMRRSELRIQYSRSGQTLLQRKVHP